LQISTKLCAQVLALDGSIRFAGLANMRGKIVAAEYRKGTAPLLTREESELSVTQSVLRMGTRSTMEAKLGRTVFAFAMYERVKRATIPLHDPDKHILMVSFDVDADHDWIIMGKILPLLKI
jgi:hypothetical protein